MKDRMVLLMILAICVTVTAHAGVDYSTPAGGWFYIMEGDSDVAADNWYEDNSEWDGSVIGEGSPGGVSYLTEGDVTFMRVQDPGDPRDYGMPDDSNRKIAFFHDLDDDGLSAAMGDTLLDDGVTLSFRARLATAATGPIDDTYWNGGGTNNPWPENGDGHEIHNEGNSMFVIHQRLPLDGGDDDGASVGFTLTSVPDNDRTHTVAGLHMNNLDGAAAVASAEVDTGNGGGTKNYSTAFDTTEWHEFWITIEGDYDVGTHIVTVYMDGELLEGQVFNVTAGHGDNSGNKGAFLQMGSTNTDDSMAFDLDFIAYSPGIIAPVPNDPTYNPGPTADAGAAQVTYIGDTVQLAGIATDEGPEDGVSEGSPGGITSLYWKQKSGAGTATFSATDVLDATVSFDAKGTYELMLRAFDIAGLDANDLVTITVRDHADEFLVGHWPLDGDALDASLNSNDGTLMGTPGVEGGMPIYTEDAAVGSHSIDISDRLGLEAINSHDPNMPYIALGAATELDFGTSDWTVSGWIKTTQAKGSGDLGKGTIFGNGGDQTGGHRYCLIVSEGGAGQTTLVTDDNVDKYTTENDGPDNDGNWHLIVGVRDGGEIRIYRDGVLEGTNSGPSDDYDLSGTSQHGSYIGMLTDNRDSTLYKHLDGLIDDVRVYNYALPLDGDPAYDSILSLTAMGPIVATVDAGPDADFTWRPGWELALGGAISDLGADNPMIVLWTTESGPGEATFISPSDPVSMVTFPAGGTYVLKLTVIDEDVTVEDTVSITVIAPTCEDVVADGLLLATDLNGDCRVDLGDLAIMLANWAMCNDPIDAACDWPF